MWSTASGVTVMIDRNASAALAVAFVALAAIGLAFGAGGAAAQTDSTAFVDNSLDVTNDTESVYVDVTAIADMNGSGPVDVNVTIEGIRENQSVRNGTVLNQSTISVAANTTESLDIALSDSDRSDYDQIHVTVSAADVTLIDTYDYGTIGAISGGGGGGLSAGGSTGVIAVVAVIAGLLYVRGDE